MRPASRWFAKSPRGFCVQGKHTEMLFDDCHMLAYRDTNWMRIVNSLPPGSLELYIKQIANVQFWQKMNGVTVFPSEELVEKCVHTDALGSVRGVDVFPSFPTILFTLPASMAHRVPGGGEIGHMLASFYEPDTPCVATIDTKPIAMFMPPNKRYLAISAYWNTDFVNNFTIPLDDRAIAPVIADMRKHSIVDEVRQTCMSREQAKREEDETVEISNWAISLTVNLLLLMQSYPLFLTRANEKNDRVHVYRDRPAPATYMLTRVRSLLPPHVYEGGHPQPAEPGSHSSPYAHWRRGHWRRQPHTGSWLADHPNEAEITLLDGRQAHMVWIEPMFVGIKQAEPELPTIDIDFPTPDDDRIRVRKVQ